MSAADHMRAIAVECRKRGLTVVAMPGWETRGLGVLDPNHVIAHHTAAARDIDRMLRDGRSDLRGPLCNLALHADGTVVLVAAGRANHAGRGIVTASESYGIEATGPVPISAKGPAAFPNYQAYVQLCAAIRKHHGWGANRVVAHKETARPLGRKIDPSFEMKPFRAAVTRALTDPPTLKEAEDMPLTTEERNWIRTLEVDTRKELTALIARVEERLTAKLDALTAAPKEPTQ